MQRRDQTVGVLIWIIFHDFNIRLYKKYDILYIFKFFVYIISKWINSKQLDSINIWLNTH